MAVVLKKRNRVYLPREHRGLAYRSDHHGRRDNGGRGFVAAKAAVVRDNRGQVDLHARLGREDDRTRAAAHRTYRACGIASRWNRAWGFGAVPVAARNLGAWSCVVPASVRGTCGARAALLSAEKGFEETRHVFFGNPRSLVLHLNDE